MSSLGMARWSYHKMHFQVKAMEVTLVKVERRRRLFEFKVVGRWW